ncbi:MAG: MotA/TolQ/ExbB proton channel family protein [Pirellulales bacterium]
MKTVDLKPVRRATRWLGAIAALLLVLGIHFCLESEHLAAQTSDDAARKAEEALRPAPANTGAGANTTQAADDGLSDMSLLELYVAGGVFMIPITVLSLIALAFAVERTFALRRSRVLPPDLVEGFGEMAAAGGFDPRKAYRLCQQHPSPAANVIRAMLLKVGRPHAEVEQAVSEASDREATKLYSNVRPIALTVTIAPLLGLLGTVQGMIMAFHQTAFAAVGVNKAQALAAGIYTALVTTFAGLTVAIPAACLVHFLEGRILGRFREIDELLFNLLPQVERYEGTLRVSRQQLVEASHGSDAPTIATVAPAAATN